VIMLFIAVILAGVVTWTRGDIAYLLVLVWAFVGIAIKHAPTPLVANMAWVATALVLGEAILAFARRRVLMT
jgi:hypothetical protein